MLNSDAENQKTQTGQQGRSGVSVVPVRAVVACGWWGPGWSVGPPVQRASATRGGAKMPKEKSENSLKKMVTMMIMMTVIAPILEGHGTRGEELHVSAVRLVVLRCLGGLVAEAIDRPRSFLGGGGEMGM